MKAHELVVGNKYWCGWASRYARFVRIKESSWCGVVKRVAVFRDICDCIIECDVDHIDKWVKEA